MKKKHFQPMDHVVEVAFVGVAAYNLKEDVSPTHCRDRAACGLNPREEPNGGDIETLRTNRTYMGNTELKITHMLRAMAMNGHTRLVLGALGCGAFANPPELVAEIFHKVLTSNEFRGRFKSVEFAILNLNPRTDQRNIDVFTDMCSHLQNQ